MKRRFRFEHGVLLGLGIFLLSLLLVGFAQQNELEPPEIRDMQAYTDPGMGFSITYPKDWYVNAQVGRAYFYNSQEVELKFLDPKGSHPHGVVIAVTAKKTSDVKATIEEFRQEMAKSGSRVGVERSVKVGNLEGLKVPYIATFDSKTIIHGYHILIATDSVVYDLGVAGFGDFFDAYSAVFEASLNSFQLPNAQTVGVDGF
jgi:hypothetical protein